MNTVNTGKKLSPEDIQRVKALGCLRDKRYDDVFNVRVITRNGRITAAEHHAIAEASEKFGSGAVAMTTRLTLEIQGVKFFKQFVIVKFKGIDNINDIEKYRGKSLLVDRKDAVPLKQDEYFIADMVGIDVYTEDGEKFGVLKDVMETGANDVYIINSINHGEVLVPAIKQCILGVDIEENRMDIHLMDGLI